MPAPQWYTEWMETIRPGDMVYVGDRDLSTVYYWPVSEVEDGYAYINEFEFDLESGFGPPGKLLYPTERVTTRFFNQGLAEKIEALCKRGDLTHLNRESLLQIHDLLMDEYENAGYTPSGLKERTSRYAGKQSQQSRGKAGRDKGRRKDG